jgi:hypothetical protein
MPRPVLTLAAAWAAFDAMVFDGGVTSVSRTQARRVLRDGGGPKLASTPGPEYRHGGRLVPRRRLVNSCVMRVGSEPPGFRRR